MEEKSVEMGRSAEAVRETDGKTAETDRSAGTVQEADRTAASETAPMSRAGLSHGEDISERDRQLLYYVNKVQNPDTQQYIKVRILSEMKYYGTQSAVHKKQYYSLSTLAIILGALIPIASIFTGGSIGMTVVIAALGSAVTAINAYLSLRNSRDVWLMNRETREELLQTLLYYFNNADIFSGETMTQEEKDRLLIETCEARLSEEHSEHRAIRSKNEGD